MSRVIVVGGGNAALCAALSAREAGADVDVYECAPESLAGGNTAFTAGSIRVPYRNMEELCTLMPDLSDEERAAPIPPYPPEEFYSDLARVSEYRADPELAERLAEQAYESLVWMTKFGVRFVPRFAGGEEAKNFTPNDGPVLGAAGGGVGLVAALTEACKKHDITIHYSSRVVDLLQRETAVTGVTVIQDDKKREETASAVVLACGGFQSNAEWRSRYLGPGWDLAKVRGTMFNNGDGHKMAIDIGASAAGHWSGCHAVGWDRNAPEYGDIAIGDQFEKHSYPYSVMIDATGNRFLDEGADFRNFTYAKYGRRILERPGQFAWQVFDQKVLHLLRSEYHIRQITKASANTIEELAKRMEGVDAAQFLRTIGGYNAAVMVDTPFSPYEKDGRGTRGLAVPKTNWANTIDTPPFEAYAVTCGVTFTFGGLRIDTDARVLDTAHRPIPGLFAAGELVGGMFYFNYPGGSGLTNGTVFGKIAGANASKL